MHPDTLKDSTIRGLRWLAATRVVGETLAFVAAVALARLITPADFGHAAVALIFLPLAGILTFEGFASSLVQRDEVDETDIRAALFMSIVGGLLLSGAVFGLAWPLWQPLFGTETAQLIKLISPILLIAALGGVSRAKLLRTLDFPKTSVIDTASVISGYVVAVTLAAVGLGARAIIIGALVQTAVNSGLLLAAAPVPSPRWSRRAGGVAAGFGIPAALAGLVEVLFRNIDYAILAARLSATATGLYYRAFNLGVVYQDKVSGIMVQVAYPLYSRTNDVNRLRSIHERAARVHAAILFPAQALLIVLAPYLVPLLFGSAWTAAVEPTQVLALAGMLAAVLTGYSQVMLAIGRPRRLLLFNVARLGLYGGVVLLASTHGLLTVAVAVVGAYLVILVAAYALLLGPCIGISVKRLVPELAPAVSGCLALAAVAVPLTNLLDGIPRILLIGIVSAVGLSAYAVTLRLGFPAAWADARTLAVQVTGPLANRFRGGGGTGSPDGASTDPNAQGGAPEAAVAGVSSVAVALPPDETAIPA